VYSECVNGAKKRWCVLLSGRLRGTKETLGNFASLSKGNQVRGAIISYLNDIICNCVIY